MGAAKVLVDIVSRYDDAGSSQAAKGFDKLTKGATVAAAGIAAGAAVSVNAAMDQESALVGLAATFDKTGGQAAQWATQQTKAGLSTKDAAIGLTSFGGALQAAGVEEAKAAEQSKELTLLAADLASTYGGTAADAVGALGGAFRGEYDALEKYNVIVKEADVAARLAAKGQDELTGSAKKEAEAVARLELIWEGSTDAQGASTDATVTAAEAQAELRAEMTDLAAEIGNELLPYFKTFVDILGNVVGWIRDNKELFLAFVGIVGGLAAAVLAVNAALAIYETVTAIAAAVTWLMNTALLANPLTWIVLLIIAVVAAIVLFVLWIKNLYEENETFRRIVDAAWSKIRELWDRMVDAITKAWDVFFSWLKETVTKIVDAVKRAVAFIREDWAAMVAKVRSVWESLTGWLTRDWQAMVQKLTAGVDKVRQAFRTMVDAVKRILDQISTKISEISRKVTGGFVSAFNTAKRIIGGAIDFLIRKVRELLDLLGNALSKANPFSGFGSIFGRSVAGPAVPQTSASSSSSGGVTPLYGYGSVTINVNESTDSWVTAARVKRAIEGYDVGQGRAPGKVLARSW